MRLIGFLQHNLRNCSKELKELSYKQFILLILEYASTLWDPYHLCNINKIEMIQHRVARFVLGCPWRRDLRDSITSILSSLGWPSWQLRRKCARLTLLFKLLHNFLVISPEYLQYCHQWPRQEQIMISSFCITRPLLTATSSSFFQERFQSGMLSHHI